MRHFAYVIIGGLVGLMIGTVFGFVFDSFYTKKSILETKQTIQAVIFGGIGVIGGAAIGFKIADEIEDEILKKKEYAKSLIDTSCEFCHGSFKYSTLEYKTKSYCDRCILTIKYDYIDKCKQINKIVAGIEELKMPHAIKNRLDKTENIAMSLTKYETVNLDFITKKPSQILKSISDYKQEHGI